MGHVGDRFGAVRGPIWDTLAIDLAHVGDQFGTVWGSIWEPIWDRLVHPSTGKNQGGSWGAARPLGINPRKRRESIVKVMAA